MTGEKQSTVRVSGREAMYLRNATFLPDELALVVQTAVIDNENEFVICLSKETSEQFRDIFTEYLAKVGFDDAYQTTSEGNVLEALIDIFNLG